MKPEARDGVPPSQLRVRPGEPDSVLALLQFRFPHAPDWQSRLQAGAVLDARGQPLSADSRCAAGALIWYWRHAPDEPRHPSALTVLHQCEQLVVVDKPPFMAVTPAGPHLRETVLLRLQQQLALPDLSPLHRLDRDTAGVLAFAVKPGTRAAYQALWRERAVHKVYEAIAPWRGDLAFPLVARHRLVEPAGAGFMQMQVVAGEPNAETLIECLGKLEQGLALYRLQPHTGRKHQLRAQMAALGLPIVNDRLYPQLLPPALDDLSRPLQLLARSLRFIDPLSGLPRQFESELRLATSVRIS